MDIIFAFVVIVGAIGGFVFLDGVANKKKGQPPSAKAKHPPGPGVLVPGNPEMKWVIQLEGVERRKLDDLGFTRQFGHAPAQIRDVVFRRGPGLLASLPAKLQDAIRATYKEGLLVGPQARDLALGGDIGEGHSLFLVLNAPDGRQPYLSGFVAPH